MLTIMNKFNEAWEYLKENEGGYNNIKEDKGGATKYGISLRFLKGLKYDEGDINRDGQVDIRDIQGLSEEEAKALFKTHFWDAAKCDELKYDKIAIKVFDLRVNFGVKRGIRILQTAINKMHNMNVLKMDGVFGPKTQEAVNKASEKQLMENIISISSAIYESITRNNPTQAKFLKGWIKRARRTPKIC